MRAVGALLAGVVLAALLVASACSLKPPFECGGDAGCWAEPDLTIVDAASEPDLATPVDLAAHPD